MKLTRKTFMCTDTQIEMMELIKAKYGLKSMTSVFDRALQECYRDAFRYGSDPMAVDRKFVTNSNSIEIKAKQKADIKEAERKASLEKRLEPKKNICLALGGTITEQEDGTMLCTWHNHDIRNSTEQTLPMEMMGEYLIQNQYIPDKETVLKARSDLRSNGLAGNNV